MRRDTFTLAGAAGKLVVRTWTASTGRYVVLLAHGIAEHAGRYDHVAAHLIDHGARAVYGPDHAGHGLSAGPRADFGDVQTLVDDLESVAARLREEHPDLPLVLLGHCLGGLMATRFAQRHDHQLAALVLSAPLIGGNPDFEELLASRSMPRVPIDPAILSRDPDVGAAYQSDPLVHHGPLSRRTLGAIFEAVDAVWAGLDLGDVPTLWIHGELDSLAPYDATATAFKVVGGTALRQRRYAGARHEIFNETNRQEVLSDVTGFLSDVLS